MQHGEDDISRTLVIPVGELPGSIGSTVLALGPTVHHQPGGEMTPRQLSMVRGRVGRPKSDEWGSMTDHMRIGHWLGGGDVRQAEEPAWRIHQHNGRPLASPRAYAYF
jgi:hypothetical protein